MKATRDGATITESATNKDDVVETVVAVMEEDKPDRDVNIGRGWSETPFVSNGLNEVHIEVDPGSGIRIDWGNVTSSLSKKLMKRFQDFPDTDGPERVNPNVDDSRSHAEIDTEKFTKSDAGYMEPFENNTPNSCANCAHYDEAGGCKVVEGDVDPEGVCSDLYADFGVFIGMDERGNPEVTLTMWGEEADIRATDRTIPRALNSIEEELNKRFNK